MQWMAFCDLVYIKLIDYDFLCYGVQFLSPRSPYKGAAACEIIWEITNVTMTGLWQIYVSPIN